METLISSPFICRKGAIFISEPCGHLSEDYARKCFTTQRLTQYDKDVISSIYKLGFVTRHQLEALFTERTDRSLKRCLSKLTGNSFLVRHYCSAPDRMTSVYFYSVNDSCISIMRKYLISAPMPCYYDPVSAVKVLASNQLYVRMLSSPAVIKDSLVPAFAFKMSGFTCRCGTTFSLNVSSGVVRIISFVVRRNDNWAPVALNTIRMILGYTGHGAEAVFPLAICEDLIHVRQLRLEIAKDARLAEHTVLYTYDALCNSDDPLSSLQKYEGNDVAGNPVFSMCHF